jgi:hypothetical protein
MSLKILDSLIVRNLADLDATAKRVEVIGERVFNALGHHIEAWAEQADWVGEFDGNEDIWCAPMAWRNAPGDEPAGCFCLELRSPDTGEQLPGEDYFLLTRLVGVGAGGYGFCFNQNVLPSKREWKPIVRAKAADLQKHGFAVDQNGYPFMDFTIDPELLATAMEDNDYFDAFEPITEALDRLKSAIPTLHSLLMKAGSVHSQTNGKCSTGV